VIIDFSRFGPGTNVILHNTVAPDPFGDPVAANLVRDIMQFRVVSGGGADTSTVPDVLADPNDLPAVPPMSAPATRSFRFNRGGGQWVINGEPFDNNRVDAVPTSNSSEIWEFVNNSGGWLHPIHPHLVQYRIICRDDNPPRRYEVGLKDVVSLGPGESARVSIAPAPNADRNNPSGFELPPTFGCQAAPTNPARYVLHCHNLAHEDDDMMTRFAVGF
jgi:FtsP/CotA-like multicopper oxidase with cupredoxin domain